MTSNTNKYIVEKGSIAINGVSLTIAKKNEESFEVAMIPHTIEMTSFCEIKIGDNVNIEVDILGKYIENFVNGKK